MGLLKHNDKRDDGDVANFYLKQHYFSSELQKAFPLFASEFKVVIALMSLFKTGITRQMKTFSDNTFEPTYVR